MSMRTDEEKIRICTKFLQSHGYQVITPKNSKLRSAEVSRLVAAQREKMLAAGGASMATLLSTSDVCALLKCSGQHVRDLVKAGRLAAPIAKGRWRLRDVQAYAAGAVRGSDETPA